MKTPIYDFCKRYAESETTRFHVPGHKGRAILGIEQLDLTEISGADELYEAQGIIGESENNATDLFGTQKTVYSVEGSSQCIRAMTYLAVKNKTADMKPVIIAPRNAHKAFIYSAALVDFDVEWIYPKESHSVISCTVTPEDLENTLSNLRYTPCGVYITSPDYLGNSADIKGLSEVCHKHNTVLLVDNAHGSYLHFLDNPQHPMDFGADMCCDSAHKTLPVLTGGAYLHINKNANILYAENAKSSMALFGSTSPSYLILSSLDLCNDYLKNHIKEDLKEATFKVAKLKKQLTVNGWSVENSDPLRVTIKAPNGISGKEIAQKLKIGSVECEYADKDYIVLMATAFNSDKDYEKVTEALGINNLPYVNHKALPTVKCEKALSIREAMFSRSKTIPVEFSAGRICVETTVSCPPAIPIVVSGEIISEEAVRVFKEYGVERVAVVG
ncbi:MAG: aminotransferase class I/II-fold pyridoxal phosphate-dependent enzyme [Oscillospiraceae bacterium]|nr:aminotransferase class I/II-fold pyridoxal phosphate-dependent enzyme [Oscillospiraceae bacterium]